MADNLRLAPGLYWPTSAEEAQELLNGKVLTVRFSVFRREFIEPARSLGRERSTLDLAAADVLAFFAENPVLCVQAVPVRTVGDLRDIYGYLVEPVFRRHGTLILVAEEGLDQLRDEDFVDPDVGYAWTLQRLRYIADRYWRRSVGNGLPPMTPIEELLFQAMRARGFAPRSQYGIGPYRADFAFPEHNLAVECDGRQWHDEARDRRRDAHLRKLGWEVLHLTGSEIVRSPEDAARAVEESLALSGTRLTFTELEEAEERSWWSRLLEVLAALFGRRARNVDGWPGTEEGADKKPADDSPTGLDPEQRAAVISHDGVVQVIAPAGSGKTKVMVQRVAELLARGVPANRILCTTFNAAAVDELEQRLSVAGISGVSTKTFHGIGYAILRSENKLRGDVRACTYSQWRRLAKMAMDHTENGVWVEAADAQEAISNLKLADMVTPEKALARARDPRAKTIATMYQLYEQELEADDLLDYDDLVEDAINLLQTDGKIRATWQEKWEHVLVDEYQDIEPAQELLVRILAAPQDAMFVVGDEDQCIYAWRRARVERIIELDQAYPGLERSVLKRNYRSAAKIVALSARLVAQNKRRFPKEIVAHSRVPGLVEISQASNEAETGEFVAGLLSEMGEDRQAAVLARTTFALKETALACARNELHFQAPQKLVELSGAERTVLAYLRLFADLDHAQPDDVSAVFRVPNRYLAQGAEEQVAQALREGRSFAQALARVKGEDWRRTRLDQAAEFFDRLVDVAEAEEFVKQIRAGGGLDKHFADQEEMSPHDKDDIDVLDDVQRRAEGKPLETLAALVEQDAELLKRFVGDKGPELTTIHGAKGRQWNHVIVVGADDRMLPHHRSVADNPYAIDDEQEGLEGERRLAYVAFTRPMDRLTICYAGAPSRFLVEAGVMSQAEWKSAREKAAKPLVSDDRFARSSDADKAAAPTGVKPAPNLSVNPDGQSLAAIAEIRKKYARAYMPWTELEDQKLLELYEDGVTIMEIATELGRQPGGIRARLQKVGLLDPVE